MNLHEIPFPLLTITEHSSLALLLLYQLCCFPVLQWSWETKARDSGWSSWLLLAVFACLSSSHMDPWFFPGHFIHREWEVLRVEVPKMAGPWKRGPCDEFQPWLVNTSLCMGAIVERIKATMCFLRCIRRWRSHCHGSWRLGPLIDTYTTPCCRALFHLDPVAKFVWKSS